MDLATRLPASVLRNATEFVESGRPAVGTRLASTVVLIRDGDGKPGGLEVFLLTRQLTMANFPGAAVFPGGGVERQDYDHRIPWAPSADRLAIPGLAPADAKAAVSAAVRETFEESAVLLAARVGCSGAQRQPGGADHQRNALEAGDVTFADFLSSRGLELTPDLLTYWGAWITPEFQPVRFDARFFFAQIAAGLDARAASTESLTGQWVPVRMAITATDRGSMHLMPPTYVICLELFRFLRAADAIAVLRSTVRPTITPRLDVRPSGVVLRIPGRFSELNGAVHAELEAAAD